MPKVFISFSSSDLEFAEVIASELLAAGHEPWQFHAEMVGGDRLWNVISQKIQNSTIFVVLISPNALKSAWVNEEISCAVASQIRGTLDKVIPVLINNASVPSSLNHLVHIEENSPITAAKKVIEAIEANRNVPKKAHKTRGVVVIGSALVEDIVSIAKEHEIDHQYLRTNSKYIAQKRKQYFGGSGVNFFVRLCTIGNHVVPILSAGKDSQGEALQRLLTQIAKDHGSPDEFTNLISEERFLCAGLSTSETVVISVRHSSRLTITPELIGIESFPKFMRERLDVVTRASTIEVDSVMIGHLPADAEKLERGALTRLIIERFHDSALVFANFGSSQLGLGCEFWRADMQRLSLIQFSLPEVFDFFKRDHPAFSLSEIIRWFMDNRITAVITHDRFGIIGTYSGGAIVDQVVIADPFYIGVIEDKTGAGDAFGSGMVHELRNKKNKFSFDDFMSAIDTGRVWAAYACTVFGSSVGSPTMEELKGFVSNYNSSSIGKVQVRDLNEMQWYLRVIELTIRR